MTWKTIAALGVPLLWSTMVRPLLRLGIRGRTLVEVVFATAYGCVFGAGPRWWSRRGWAWGSATVLPVIAGYGVALAIPPLRARLSACAGRAPDVSVSEWATVHIPIGTVYSEELVFRATLDPLFDSAGPIGHLLGATAFGLWHGQPARAVGDNVPVSVAVTAVGGFVLSWLRRRSGSTIAPALLHAAINVGGALAVHSAARAPCSTGRRTSFPSCRCGSAGNSGCARSQSSE